jgi:hypothetical protein
MQNGAFIITIELLKIRATNDRFRCRDFYDFGMIMKEFKLDLSTIVELIKRKEIHH